MGLAALFGGVACADTTSPTSPSNLIVTTSITELFAGTLPARGTRFFSYTVTQPGTVFLTLASLTAGSNPASSRVTLGVGIPAGTGCALQESTITSAALTSQLQHSSPIGIYCVSVADTDGLPSDMAFAVRIVHP